MTIETLGIDSDKNVFQLHGVSRNGQAILKRRVMRDEFLTVIAQIEPCTVVMEACTGPFYWARKFEALGHQVKLISSQYVKPFVRRQKTTGMTPYSGTMKRASVSRRSGASDPKPPLP
jgi:transposase